MLKTKASWRLSVFLAMRNSGAFYPFMTTKFSLAEFVSLYNLEETAKSCPTTVTNTRSTYKNARLTALESRSFCFSDQHILHRQQQNKLFCTAVPMWLGSAISPSKRLFYPLQSSALEMSKEPNK